jgi:transmembrane sensor
MVAFRSTEGRVTPELVVGAADPAQLDGTLAWRERRLKFAATPLGDVVAEFNRYNSHQLVIADPALAAEPFGGAFAPNGYEALVELLQESFGVVADRRASQTILQKRR